MRVLCIGEHLIHAGVHQLPTIACYRRILIIHNKTLHCFSSVWRKLTEMSASRRLNERLARYNYLYDDDDALGKSKPDNADSDPSSATVTDGDTPPQVPADDVLANESSTLNNNVSKEPAQRVNCRQSSRESASSVCTNDGAAAAVSTAVYPTSSYSQPRGVLLGSSITASHSHNRASSPTTHSKQSFSSTVSVFALPLVCLLLYLHTVILHAVVHFQLTGATYYYYCQRCRQAAYIGRLCKKQRVDGISVMRSQL